MRILIAVVLGALLSTCSSPPSLLERIIRSGELRVVTRNTPAAFYYGAEEPRGIEYELARGYAERLGVGLRIYVNDHVFADVASGKAQIGAASLTVSDARLDTVTFGPAYQNIQPEVIYRRGTKRPQRVEDLVGGRLEVVAHSSHAELLTKLRRQVPLLTWIEHPQSSGEELIRRVAEGDIDYTIADSHLFELLRHFYPDLRVAFTLDPVDHIAWALPRGDDSLRESVAAYFAEIQSTGKLQQILDRYYFASSEFDYVSSRAFVRHVNTRLPRYRDFFLEAERSTGIDWRLLAAIAYQESHWDPMAVSPTGVRGMMMLTEFAADAMEIADRHDARASILGGARYFLRTRAKVPERIPEPDRSWLTVASYNLGYGHVEDARILTQRQGANPDRWDQVRQRLPLLSEKEVYESLQRGFAPGQTAVAYVDNIRRYYEILMWLDSRETLTSQGFPPALPTPIG
ncbi:MAG TPA: membrane-bound lytic murein transglycosylase MltF [Gammaproteobacteria bacterium]|nr:membrane-bound lytic murein transglycosylase MltF [Gammaproteobacteria bacterium]